MKQNKTLKVILLFLVVLFTYFIIFKSIWGFNVLNVMQWKMVFHYINTGVSLSPVFLVTAFSFPFVFATCYWVLSALTYENENKPIVQNIEQKPVLQNVAMFNANQDKPALVNGVDIGFIPEYKMDKTVNVRQEHHKERVEELVDDSKNEEIIAGLLNGANFDFLDKPEIEDFRLSYFAVADRMLLCGAYFNNDNTTISEDSLSLTPSWLKNGKIIESPMYKLSVINKMFKTQAEEVLDGVKVDFVGVLFLSETPSNLTEINEKAKEYNLKVVCLDNLPADFEMFIVGHKIKRNTDVYFEKFISSVAHYLDPTFFYNPDEDAGDEE